MTRTRKTRRSLYRAASILGDIDAIASGSPKRMARRLYNKSLWKIVARIASLGMWRPR